MAKFCIKPGLKEVEELATNLNLPYSIVSAKIVTWAEQNNEYSRFPSLEELNIKPQYQKLTANEKAKTIEQVTKEHRSIAALKDLAHKLAHRIGGKVEFENKTDVDWKGYNQGMTSVLNEAYMTPDTPFHEILAHPIIRVIKNRIDTTSTVYEENKPPQLGRIGKGKGLYQSLLKELETGRGKEVFEQVKRDYLYKETKKRIPDSGIFTTLDGVIFSVETPYGKEYQTYIDKDGNEITENVATYYKEDNTSPEAYLKGKVEISQEEYIAAMDKIRGESYTLEEQQEEAIVTLLGLMAADKLDAKKDTTLISKLKEFWKQISDFVKSLLRQDGIKIDELPITTTLNDLAEIMAYGNNKIILPGYKIEYSTPLGNKYDTLEEVNQEIRGLSDANVEVDLSGVKLKDKNKVNSVDEIKVDEFAGVFEDFIKVNGKWYNQFVFDPNHDYSKDTPVSDKEIIAQWNSRFDEVNEYKIEKGGLEGFIERNKEYEQSKEIIEQWKKENNIQYDLEEVYSRGQGFYSSIGAYSNLELDLLLKNLIQHIQDNKKAGGEFTISAFTKPVNSRLKHIEGTGDRVRFVIYPKSEHIKWAAPTDVYSGSVWDAHEKVSKDKKSELLGVSFTKAPSLRNINEVSPNLADIIDNLSHIHNELGIELTTNNFRIEYDDNIDYSTKKLIDNINKILDDKYGKLVKPEISKKSRLNELNPNYKYVAKRMSSNELHPTHNKNSYAVYQVLGNGELSIISTEEDYLEPYLFDTKEQADNFIKANTEQIGKQPTQTKGNTTSIESVKDKLNIQTDDSKNQYERDLKNYELASKGILPEYYSKYTDFDGLLPKKIAIFAHKNQATIWQNIEYDNILKPFIKEASQNQHGVKFWILKDSFTKDALESYKKPEELIENTKEYTSQALTNLKIAALKEVARKYPRSLITSKVVPINPNMVDNSEIQYSKKQGYSPKTITDEYGNTWNEIDLTQEEINFKSIPKFSLEDNNETLPQEELQDFINSLEVDKQYRFNYRVGEEVHEKYISLEEFDNTSFTGKNLATGISETFDYNNLTQNSTEVTNKLTVDEYVAVMKNILLSQEKIFSSRVSNEGDRVLHTKIVNSLKILEDYTDYADIEKFFDVVSENITQVGKLIKEINKYTDSNLAQLKRIGLLKDFIDSYRTTLNEILIPIKELSEGEALDNKVSLLIADIKRAEQYYFEIARPKVAKWLMEHLSPAMNEELERLGFKNLTAKDLEKELKNPTSDLSWVDTFLVAASNVNDKVTGLFSLALKKADQTARTLNVKLKNLLHPLHEELLKRSKEEIKATYQRMFTEETVTLGEEQIKVWKWIKEDNSDEFYNQKKALQAKINAAKELAQNNPSNEELSKKYKQAIKDLRTFLSTNGTAYTQTQMNELMEELRTSNWHRFDNYLKWYYEPIPPEEATVNDIRIGEGFSTQEFRYRDNFYKPKQELYSNKAYFDKFKEEDPLGYKLYKALHDSYMEAENKRPEDKRLNGVIPLDLMNEPNHLKEKKHLVKLDGDIYKEIPVRFSPYRNVDLTDLNITKGVINYVSQVNLQQSYSKILGAVDATVNTVKDSKPKNKDGSNIGTNRRLDKITDMVAQQIYREFNKDTGTWGKLLDNINQLVSWSTIGFSPISSSVNIVVGNIANYIEAMGGRRYTLKEHGEALAEFGKLLPDYISKGSESKLGRILERFDAIQGEFNKNLLNDFEYLRDDRKIKRKIRTSLSNVYFMQNAGEFEIQGTSTLALMKAAGVWELFDDEGNLKSGEETFEGEEAFVNKLHAMNKNNHGVYNSFDRLPWQTSAVFRLALAFRKWIVPTFRSRYYGIFDKRGEGARLDFEAGTVEQGYYTSFRDFVYDNYKSFMDNGTLILNFDNLSEVEKEGVKRTLQDMLVVATALALVLLLRAAVGDEGDDESLATWILINTFNRVASDYIAYLPLLGIDDQLRTASTPFVAYRKIREMGDIIGDLTIGFLPDKDGVELFKTYKRNIGLHKKGDSKFVAKIEKIIPYYNIIEFLNPKTQFENFEKTRR